MNGIDVHIASLKKFVSTASIQVAEDNEDEDFNPMDYSGGNFDDAYSMGVDAGEVFAARNQKEAIEALIAEVERLRQKT